MKQFLLITPGGTCDACHGIVYEHILNTKFQQHHSIGDVCRSSNYSNNTDTMSDSSSRPPPPDSCRQESTADTIMMVTDSSCEDKQLQQIMPQEEQQDQQQNYHHHCSGGGNNITSATNNNNPPSKPPSSVTMYQRRAQFRANREGGRQQQNKKSKICIPFLRSAMASYQGRAIRPVPETVVDEIRGHIEGAQHLIHQDETEAIKRYAQVTRVHVLCILRSNGSNRYNRWYRESRSRIWMLFVEQNNWIIHPSIGHPHHIHSRVTAQPPPDISDLEPTMLFILVRSVHKNKCNENPILTHL